MKKILLAFCMIVTGTAAYSQLLYNMGDSANSVYRATSFQQTNNATNSQAVVFDDVHVPAALVAAFDSIRITKLEFVIARYANAPATTMNVWMTTVVDTATTYANLIKVPPTLIGTINLPANTGAAAGFRVSLGDSVSTLARVKVDTGNYYSNFSSFYLGVSYTDTTGNGWFLGGNTGNVYPNDNVFWRYVPTATTQVSPLAFAAPTRSRFAVRVYGTPSAPLPITISSFDARYINNNTVLDWATASESNSSHFEVEVSRNALEFTPLGNVAAAGSSNISQKYGYKHLNPSAGINYYRLKLVDKDGTFKYSSVQKVLVSSEVVKLQITPNPVKSNIRFEWNNQGTYQYQVLGVTGNRFKAGNILKGLNNVDVSTLPTGVYFMEIYNGEGQKVTTEKIFKQ